MTFSISFIFQEILSFAVNLLQRTEPLLKENWSDAMVVLPNSGDIKTTNPKVRVYALSNISQPSSNPQFTKIIFVLK